MPELPLIDPLGDDFPIPDLQSLRALNAALDKIDPRLLSLGMKVWQEYQRGDDRNTALLAALRPFVREERWARLDKAMQLARMARVIRMALGAFGKGEEDHL